MADKDNPRDSEPKPDLSGSGEPVREDATLDGFEPEETIQIGNDDSTIVPDPNSTPVPSDSTPAPSDSTPAPSDSTPVPSDSTQGVTRAKGSDGHPPADDEKSASASESESESDVADGAGPDDSGDQLDATVNLETTVRVEPGDEEEVEQDIQSTTDVDPSKKTVKANEVDLTVELDSNDRTAGGTVVYGGKPKSPKSSKDTVSNSTIDVTDGRGATVVAGGSILASPNIGETINPRELSRDDADKWNTAVGETSQDPSVLPPAIDRTFSDEQFDRLRKCNVAPLKSDKAKASDYRLVRKLGQGGMGDVFVARQGSLDRLLALKLIKPLEGKRRAQLQRTGRLETVEEERRLQFLSEAIVTGDLDHPNIVPIHDVALTSSNELFYAMKRVVGTPWSDVIKENTRDENIEILLKAADAIGFAHTRGVVHRDIKPENIMLGDFGVVMVMDWGLALPTSNYEKQNSIFATSGLGGTPAFMAPEMAIGPLEKIGPASDIYLLGATLFMIITGAAPHHAKNVTECLQAVRSNKIREVPEAQKGELLDIALKAMESNPQDRFPDVESFQKAIRTYRSHAESVSLASRAADDLQDGKQNRSYSALSRAAFRYEESIKCWEGNEKAQQGLAETKLVHAEAAYQNGDFDLGLSLLDDTVPEHEPLIEKLQAGIRERDSHAARLSLMRKLAVAMSAFIIVGTSYATFAIYQSKLAADQSAEEARLAENEALEALGIASAAKLAAETAEAATREANDQLASANTALDGKNQLLDTANKELDSKNKELDNKIAELGVANTRLIEQKVEIQETNQQLAKSLEKEEVARLAAEAATKNAEYEEYVSKIGLAKARLDRNEADGAREILQELRGRRQSTLGWEWRWLWQQANQSEAAWADSAVTDLSVAPSGRAGAIALENGTVNRFTLSSEGRISELHGISAIKLGGLHATAVAISPREETIAVGTENGDILLLSPEGRLVLRGHTEQISDLKFTQDEILVSGSDDRTVRLWNARSGVELTKSKACWHISPVRQVAVTRTGDSFTMVAAIADDATGQVAIWKLTPQGDRVSVKREGTFSGHRDPVASLAISPTGGLVASGDVAGNVLIFNPASLPEIDHAGSITEALQKVKGNEKRAEGLDRPKVRFARLVDASIDRQQQLVSTVGARDKLSIAHEDWIKSIRFSADGKSLLTASDDYTLKLWDVSSRRLRKTLKGHGGWVVGGEFWQGEGDVVVSASNDATVRVWKPETYRGGYVIEESDASKDTRQRQAHSDEIWSSSFSPEKKRLRIVTASRDHTARVMEVDPATLAFREVSQLEDEVLSEGTSFVAMSMQVDLPHQRLYVGSADATIRVWDLERGTEIGQASGTGLNHSFTVSADGKLMLTGSSSPDFKAVLWQLDPQGSSSPRVVHRLKGHDQAVTAFSISPDSKLLFTGDRDGYGILWDAETAERVGPPVETVRGFRINAAHFSADGRELFLAADDEQLTRVDIGTRRLLSRLNHDGFVTQFQLSSDGRRALAVSELSTERSLETKAVLWDVQAKKGRVLDRQIQPRDDTNKAGNRDRRRITSARFGDSDRLAVIGRAARNGAPATVKVWDLTAASLGSGLEPLHAFELPATLGTAEIVWPIDRQTMLTLNNNAAFKWDLESTKLIRSYRAHSDVTEACFSFDGEFVATASRSVKIWDAETGQALGKLETPHVGPVRSVQFAPKAMLPMKHVFATGGDDATARLWHWEPQSRTIQLIKEQSFVDDRGRAKGVIRRVRFSPAADHLLVVGDHGLAQIWDLRQSITRGLPGVSDDEDFVSGRFSPSGLWVAAGSKDRMARLWELPPEPGSPASLPILVKGHSDTVNDVVMLGNSKARLRLMTASADGSIRVWDPRLGERREEKQEKEAREIIALRQHRGDVNAIDITDDGSLMLTSGSDGDVILWPARPGNPFESVE